MSAAAANGEINRYELAVTGCLVLPALFLAGGVGDIQPPVATWLGLTGLAGYAWLGLKMAQGWSTPRARLLAAATVAGAVFNNPTPLANEWLGEFGLRFDYGSRVTGDIQDRKGRRWSTATAVKVLGGGAFLNARSRAIPSPLVVVSGDAALEASEPVGAVVTVGNGRVVALGLADSFQDSVMGTTKTVPNEAQRELYEFEYALLRSATGRRAGACVPLP